MLEIPIPQAGTLRLEHLMLDVNGTLTDRGVLISEVASRITRLADALSVHLVSADTFGTLDQIAQTMRVAPVKVSAGGEKLALLQTLGAERSAVIGNGANNGANDALALTAAALGIVVIGPEGASVRALRAADVVCGSITAALDLLLDPKALSATLRQ